MRNLVLLLISGHTVRIALRDDDLPGPHGADILWAEKLLGTMPAVAKYATGNELNGVVFAYIEQEMSIDFDRISVASPGGH